jgi:hypothetical protein
MEVEMRKLWAVILTPVLALAFFIVGNPAANAFGSEVLGCVVQSSSTWTANSCYGGGGRLDNLGIQYSPHNLSGTYSKQWTVTDPSGATITSPCSSTQPSYCISSGCTTSSTTCNIVGKVGSSDRRFTATLRLTQSGLTRTIQAVAVIFGDPLCSPCP